MADDHQIVTVETIGSLAADYLDTRAAESFKRQTDLEESIWRSLPLLTGGLLAAGAIVSQVAALLPAFTLRWFPLITWAMLALAVITFAIAFWWLWQVVRPRDFDYPPDDAEVFAYAEAMRAYQIERGTDPAKTDAEVVRELRLYMARSFGTAARSTFGNNQARLSARGQVIFFLLSGFLLAFLCDATIFGTRLYHEVEQRVFRHAPHPVDSFSTAGGAEARAAHTAAAARDPRRRLAVEADDRSAGARQIMPDNKPPVAGKPAPTQRPSAPPLQNLKKVNEGGKPPPAKD